MFLVLAISSHDSLNKAKKTRHYLLVMNTTVLSVVTSPQGSCTRLKINLLPKDLLTKVSH